MASTVSREAEIPGHGGTRGSLSTTDPTPGSKWEYWSQSREGTSPGDNSKAGSSFPLNEASYLAVAFFTLIYIIIFLKT